MYYKGFPDGSVVKNLPANARDMHSISGSGRSPGEGNGNSFQYFAWKIPWTEEPGDLQSMGSQRVRQDWATNTHFQDFPGGSAVKESASMQETEVRSLVGKMPWRRKWQPTPLFFPGKSHGQRSLMSHSPWGHKELNTTEQAHTHTLNLIWSL